MADIKTQAPSHAPPTAGVAYRGRALVAALLYAALSALWILFSDRVLEAQVQDPDQLHLIQTLKGWLFVAVTAGLLYVLLSRGSCNTPDDDDAGVPRRLLLGVTAVAVLSLGAGGWWFIHENRAVAERHAGEQLLAIAQSKSAQVTDWYAERLQDAALLVDDHFGAQWLAWQQDGAPEAQQHVLQTLRNVIMRKDFQRGAVVSPDGRAWWLDWDQGPVEDLVLRRAIAEVLRTGTARGVGPWLDASGRTRLAFLAPVAAGTAYAAAVVLHVDPPPEIHPTLRTWPLASQTAEALLFRQEGDEVLFLTPLAHQPNAALRLRQPLATGSDLAASFLRGEFPPGQARFGRDYRDAAVLGVAMAIGGTDWWLIAKQDESELLADATISGLATALATLFAIVTAAVTVYLLEQRRRLQQSTASLRAVEQARRETQESEARYRLLAESGNDIVWLYDPNRQRFLYMSPSVERVFGYPPDEAVTLPLRVLLTPESALEAEQALADWLRAAETDLADDSRRFELVQRHRDGHAIPVEIDASLIRDADGRLVQIKGITRDISVRKAAEARILQLSQAMEQSPAVVIITDCNGRIEYVNRAFESVTGYTRDEAIGQTPKLLQSDKTPPETFETMWHALQAGESWSGEVINRHKTGRDYVQTITVAPVRGPSGSVDHYLSVQLDITAQRAAEDKAYQLAWFDVLTALPNRHYLMTELTSALAAARRLNRRSALLIINIDRFKTLNDAIGHSAGDRLLKRVAQRLSEEARPGDAVARLSADEFAWLMQGPMDAPTIEVAVERGAARVHEMLNAPIALAGVDSPVKVTVSIGVAVFPLHDRDAPSELLRRADTALSRAKEGGGRQTAFFDPSVDDAVGRRFAVEQDLRRGLAAGELRLFLQPQVNAAGRTVSAEALVRWQHPQRGLVPPAEFVPVAEGCDLIEPLSDWVLEAVCQHLGLLYRQGRRLPIAVNISPRHFHHATFVPDLLRRLERTGAQAHDLILEITESVVVRDVDDVVRRMGELTRHGIRFSIDDFGTGYSSLSYLKNLPIHELKIDRSFVQDAPTQPSDAALVEAILAVATHLHLRVVAEGVETAEQAAVFARHPEVILQGYLFGRPAPAVEVIERALAGSGQS